MQRCRSRIVYLTKHRSNYEQRTREASGCSIGYAGHIPTPRYATLPEGIYFTLMTLGLNTTVPQAIFKGLTQNGVAAVVATKLSQVPPFSYLFAALLGYNPLGTLLGPQVINSLSPTAAAELTSRSYFPQLISGAFDHGLKIVMGFSIVMCLIAAASSWLRGGKYVYSGKE